MRRLQRPIPFLNDKPVSVKGDIPVWLHVNTRMVQRHINGNFNSFTPTQTQLIYTSCGQQASLCDLFKSATSLKYEMSFYVSSSFDGQRLHISFMITSDLPQGKLQVRCTMAMNIFFSDCVKDNDTLMIETETQSRLYLTMHSGHNRSFSQPASALYCNAIVVGQYIRKCCRAHKWILLGIQNLEVFKFILTCIGVGTMLHVQPALELVRKMYAGLWRCVKTFP